MAKSARKYFTLSEGIKAELSIEKRLELCEELMGCYLDALKCYPDDPLHVTSFVMPGGRRLALAENPDPRRKGLVHVTVDGSDLDIDD